MKLYPSPIVDNQKWFNIVLKAVKDRISDSEFWQLYYKAKEADEKIYVEQKKWVIREQIYNKWYNRLKRYIRNIFNKLTKRFITY